MGYRFLIVLFLIGCQGSDFYKVDSVEGLTAGKSSKKSGSLLDPDDGLAPQPGTDEKKGDDDNAKLPGGGQGTTPPATPVPGSKNKKKVCEDFSDDFIGDLTASDIMHDSNFDESKLDSFLCENGKAIICHVPPGNPEASHFISVGDSLKAIGTHLEKSATSKTGELVKSYILKCSVYKDQELDNAELCGVICR